LVVLLGDGLGPDLGRCCATYLREGLMSGFLFVFELACGNGIRYSVRIPACSKQVAWAAIGGYVAAHTLNPAVESIKLIGEAKIADDDLGKGEADFVARKCDPQYAVIALCHPEP
jgi:hypothetical protein